MSITLTFRPANFADAQMVFDWSNDPLVRTQSFNTQPIVWTDHEKWFTNKLASANNMLLVALANGQPAGLVRFENISQKATIGILIASAWRGKGLAAPVISMATDAFFASHKVPVYAYIKKQNVASIRAFQRADYRFVADSDICGAPSVEYCKEP